jgi:predicted house-cleaning noncanonical NTP pyrophosphatase (MazG superfamily)
MKPMKDSVLHKFQDSVSEVLIRHKSILDIISKYQESCAKVNRSIIKAATNCGCIRIDAKAQHIPKDISYEDLKDFLDNHVSGELCDICRDKITQEMGNHLFYLVGICNTLHLDIHEILTKQSKNIETLGKYGLY